MALTKVKINLGTEGNLSGSRSIIQSTKTLVSSSAQLATDISGSFTAASSSFSTRVATMEGSGTAQGVGTSDSPTFNNITATGTVTAQEFHSEFVSASITYTSGSHKFGDSSDDIQQMTGSLNISGSLTLNDGTLTVTDNVDFNGGLDVDGDITLVSANNKISDGTNNILERTAGGYITIGDSAWNEIRLNTTGATDFVLDNSGNVGIGTASPAKPLEIEGSGAEAELVYLTSTQASNVSNRVRTTHRILTDSQERTSFSLLSGFNTITDASRNSIVEFKTSNAGTFGTAMVIDGGSVGIGTTSPNADLGVEKSVDNGDVGIRLHNSSTTGAADAKLYIITSNSSTGDPKIALSSGGGDWILGVDNSDSDKFKLARSNDDLASNTAITIDSSNNATFTGDVIIGSANGTTNGLVVKGNEPAVRIWNDGSNPTAMYITQTGTSNAWIYFDASNGDLSGGDYASIGQNNDLTLSIQTFTNAGNILLKSKGTLAQTIDGANTTFAGDVSITGTGNILDVGGGSAGSVTEHLRLSYGASDYHSIKTMFNGSVDSNNYITFDLENSGGAANKRVLSLRGDGLIEAERITINDSSALTGGLIRLEDDTTGGEARVRFRSKSSNTGTNFAHVDIGVYTNSTSANQGVFFIKNPFNNTAGTGHKFTLDHNGNVTISGTLTENSDRRLKENIENIDGALYKVNQMRGVTFDRIDTGKKEYGMIADELEEIIPELVDTVDDGDIEKEIPNLKSIRYTKLTSILIEAVKELSAQNNAFKSRIEALES